MTNYIDKKTQTDRWEAPPVVGRESFWGQRNAIPDDFRCLRVRLQAKTVIFEAAGVGLLKISQFCFYHVIILSKWEDDWFFLGLHIFLKWCCTALLGLEGAIELEGGQPLVWSLFLAGVCLRAGGKSPPLFYFFVCSTFPLWCCILIQWKLRFN